MGGEFATLGSRLSLIVNYFSRNKTPWLPNLLYGNDSFDEKGWEADVNFVVVHNQPLRYEIGVLLSSLKNGLDEGIYFADANDPDSRNSIINRLYWKRFYLSALVEHLKVLGGARSATRLRDVSLGWTILDAQSGSHPKRITASLSGRNLLKINGSGEDFEVFSEYFMKGVSLNLSVTF